MNINILILFKVLTLINIDILIIKLLAIYNKNYILCKYIIRK